MLVEFWFDQSVPVIFAMLAVFLAVPAAILRLGTAWAHRRNLLGPMGGVVAPFFGSVSVLFALLTGFVASDAWERNRQATRAILGERDALVAIHDLSLATVSDMQTIRHAVRAYIEAVVSDEWPRLRDGEASPRAADALSRLAVELADSRLSVEAGLASHQALLALWQQARSARSDRLALSQQETDHPKWWTVLILAVLTQAALALVHLEKPGGQAAALVLFSLAVWVSLGLVAVRERPFDGPLARQPTALREALRAMAPVPAVPAVEAR